MCRTFRTLFSAQAFSGRTLNLNLNTLSWRLMERKRRAAARKELVDALSRLAPSVSHLCLRYQLDACTGLSLEALLAPLSPYVRRLELEDGMCPPLLQVSARGWQVGLPCLCVGRAQLGSSCTVEWTAWQPLKHAQHAPR